MRGAGSGQPESRLSPPLKRQPALATLVDKNKSDAELETAVRKYAETQARELERIGVTMNFGPVVDLRLSSHRRDNGETQLYWRAIDSNPYVVAKVAGWYCDTLTKFNIICTLKHFPGLGRVARDTHVTTGEISAGLPQLELSDWVPFRRLMGKPGIATMVGHVRIEAPRWLGPVRLTGRQPDQSTGPRATPSAPNRTAGRALKETDGFLKGKPA